MAKRLLVMLLALLCTVSLLTVTNKAYAAEADGSVQTASVESGFVQNSDGTWSYYVDGAKVTDAVINDGGKYYGFNSSGIMYDGTSFGIYNYDEASWTYYRAKSGGELYVNEWYQPYEYNSNYKYYYGEGGKAPSGLTEVDGVQYYFYDSGEMMYSNTVTVDGVTYIVANDGKVTALTGDGWHEVDGGYYYVADGELYKSGVYQIDGLYYGFDYSGKMRTDTSFDVYDSDAGRWVYYRAKANGALYVNEWYQPYESDSYYRYYYGEGGKAPSGLTEVDGVQYYFYDSGEMMHDSSVTVDGVTYIAASDGQLTELSGNGWHEVDGSHYYVVDGEVYKSGVYQIDGIYYGFDYSGKMYTNTGFSYWDSEEQRSVYCRAKDNGALYVNEWYQPYETDSYYKYYYGEGGKSAYGLTEVDGVQCYFYSDGQMMRDSSVTVDGVIYIAASDGQLTALTGNGWKEVDGNYYYVADGEVYKNGVYQIDGLYYCFDHGGKMYTGTSVGYWDSEEERHVYYRAKDNGALYVNEWYQPYEDNSNYKYYYGEGGKSASGLTTVDGVQYYFYDSGEMMCNSSATVDGVTYIAASDGQLTALTGNGWHEVDGDYYYVADGEVYKGGVYQIDGLYYGFDYSGKMRTDTSFDVYDSDAERWVYYRAKDNGALYVNEWYQPYEDSPNYKYYYGEGGKAPSGLTEVDGVQYYFYSDGQVMYGNTTTVDGVVYIAASDGQLTALTGNGWKEVDGSYYYVADGEVYKGGVYQIDGLYYCFDHGGKMYTGTSVGYWDSEEQRHVYYRAKDNGALYVNEWYQPYEDNSNYKFYYGEGGKAPSGLAAVDGIQYYFDYDGQMLCNGAWTVDGVTYVAASDGQLTALTGNGWKEVDGDYYYVADGEVYKSGVYQIDGTYYGFNSNGRMYDDTSFDLYDSEAGRWVYYRAKSGGALYVNGWYQPHEDSPYYKYYYGEGGKAPYGLATVDGVQYYFYDNGQVMCNGAATVDGVTYVADRKGQLTALTENGWHEVDGNYYYVADGEVYKNGVYQIGGTYYGFSSSGRMYTNTSFGRYNSEEGRSVYYRAKDNGALYVNEWYQPDEDSPNYKYYYGEGGKSAFGLTMVDGVQYYFQYNGQMMCSGAATVDGVTYIADSKGQLTPMTGNGWKKVDNSYYYVADGELYTNGVYQIGGTYYGFNGNGRMFDNASFGLYDSEEGREVYYRAKSGGALCVNEWYKSGRIWYYYGEGGKAPTGLTTVGGTQYCFDYDGEMLCNGAWTVDGVIYIADSNGKLTTPSGDGWVSDGKYWYYVSEGELYENGVYRIGGIYYGFDYNGRMYTDGTFDCYDSDADRWVYYRAKASGALYVNEWYESGSAWFYYGEGGKAPYGLTDVGGIKYYFDYDGQMLCSGAWSVDSVVYIADKNGRLTVAANGWNKVDSDWYYVSDGVAYTDGVYKIGSTYYGFNYYGKMYDNTSFSVYDYDEGRRMYYRAKSGGVLYVNEWYKSGNEYYYYDSNAVRVSNKLVNINGVNYYFYSHGEMATNTVVTYDGAVYRIGANGAAAKCADGWLQHPVDNSWMYVKNSKLFNKGLLTVGGKTYVFASNEMVEDGTVYLDGSYYASDSNGILITKTGWQTVGGSYVYVMSSDGELATGWLQDGGKWYYLYPGMAHDTIIQDEDGIYYLVNASGVCTAIRSDGFHDAGSGLTIYIENGNILKSTWKQINGSWYYFDEYGSMVTGVNTIDGAKYVFDADGKMLSGGLVYYGSATYYAASSGKLQTGLQTVGDSKYIFSTSSGVMLRKMTYTTEDGKRYAIGVDGVVLGEISGEGWNLFGGKYYYIQDGVLLTEEVVEIDGKLYGFNYQGVMCTNDYYWQYFFGSDGSAISGWYQNNGEWYYADPDTHEAYSYGEYTIDGETYIFDESLRLGTFRYNGEVVTTTSGGAVITAKEPADGWSYIDGGVYYYEDGEAYTGWVGNYYVEDGYMYYNTIINVDGKYYYLDNHGENIKNQWIDLGYDQLLTKADGSLYFDEWYQSGSTWYYFSEFWMARGGIYTIDGVTHEFDENGKWLGEVTVQTSTGLNGWQKINGEYYYYHAGQPVTGEYLIDGKWYFFDYNGAMIQNSFAESGGLYYYGSNGARAEYTGWKEIYGEWVYFNDDHTLRYGWIQDGTNLYYTDWVYYDYVNGYEFEVPVMVTGYEVINGQLYYFNSNGVCQGTRGVQNGWYQAGRNWYYFINGEMATGYRQINGVGYFFSNGRMITEGFAYSNGDLHYFGADGKQVTAKGWHEVEDGWIYIGEYGEVYDGIRLIDGKVYYFYGYIWEG